jgi:hypothetical protein
MSESSFFDELLLPFGLRIRKGVACVKGNLPQEIFQGFSILAYRLDGVKYDTRYVWRRFFEDSFQFSILPQMMEYDWCIRALQLPGSFFMGTEDFLRSLERARVNLLDSNVNLWD